MKAGQELANQKHWQTLGQDERAFWGEYQGSALYRVCIDKLSLKTSCSCPSRKIPCKHSIGLLYLATSSADTVPVAAPPRRGAGLR
ncbi:SWIM zinc finger family protein [Thermogemmatispora tikiterensis]|uniref:SWIM-type domain-containing protein n=1 Tax=Thermogemmatispora tikiterensis TaxID=1825093 RepID=A0A328VFD6_9CHLR|nr:hypothetical protein A4R35_04385 [Thermogemmatispora tikiterensis]